MRWKLAIAAAAAILAFTATGPADHAFARKKQCTPHTEWPGGEYHWEKFGGHWRCVEWGYVFGPDCGVDSIVSRAVDRSKCGGTPPHK